MNTLALLINHLIFLFRTKTKSQETPLGKWFAECRYCLILILNLRYLTLLEIPSLL